MTLKKWLKRRKGEGKRLASDLMINLGRVRKTINKAVKRGTHYWYGIEVNLTNRRKCKKTGLIVVDLEPVTSDFPVGFYPAKVRVPRSLIPARVKKSRATLKHKRWIIQ